MSRTLVFTREADAQLRKLYTYLATRFSEDRAARYVEGIANFCVGLLNSPYRGSDRSEIRPGLRTVGYRRRVTVVFEVETTQLTIIGIFYGGRAFDAALRKPHFGSSLE